MRSENVYGRMISQILFHCLEYTCILLILVGLLWKKEKYIGQFFLVLLTWLLTMTLTVIVKTSFQRNLHKPERYFSNEVGGFLNSVLRIMTPFKYIRVIRNRMSKLAALGKDFIHGSSVTRKQFERVIRINQEELIDARDDVHEAFIEKMPMALLQFYLISYSPHPSYIANLIHCFRIIVILTNIIVVVQRCVVYEYIRHLYLDSAHVHGYLKTDGNYGVPLWKEDWTTRVLKIVGISASIVSRFFLIGYATRISWGHGIACTTILFLFNWLIISAFPTVLATAVNLPLGIPIKISKVITRWINTFSGIGTRFSDIARYPSQFGSYRVCLPLIFTQVINFLMAFFLVYFFVEFMNSAIKGHEAIDPSKDNATNTVNHTSSIVNHTVNVVVCNITEERVIGFTGAFVSSTLHILSFVCEDSRYNFCAMYGIHWVFFYVHVVTTLICNYYCYRYKNIESLNNYFPPLHSLLVCKQIFGKILEMERRETKINCLARFMFLLSLDLKNFNDHFDTYNRSDDEDEVTSIRWWNSKIMYLVENLDPCQTRYRSPADPSPDLTGSLVENEMYEAYAILEHLEYSHRLYLLCGRQIINTLDKEMTSRRLEATIEMLRMSKKDMLSILDNIIMTDS